MILEIIPLIIALLVANGIAIYFFLDGFYKNKKWDSATGYIERFRIKNSSEGASYIPIISYSHNNRKYSGEPCGFFTERDSDRHELVEIQINPEKPHEFCIRNQAYYVLIIVALIIDFVVLWDYEKLLK